MLLLVVIDAGGRGVDFDDGGDGGGVGVVDVDAGGGDASVK